MNKDYPLVSIIVITYNSAQFVLETLDSAKEQIYRNIELIISDDGSKDETVSICKKWVAENRDRFINVEVITVEINTGIPANCNRGVHAAKGEWIKIIAGDDVLLPNCISENVSFISKNEEAKIVQSNCNHYEDTFEEKNFIGNTQLEKAIFYREGLSASDQFKMFFKNGRISTPAIFINRNVILDCGGYDESLRYIEDYPMWIKALKKGYKFYLLESTTVNYRISVYSVNKQQKPFISLNYAKEDLRFHNKYVRNEINFVSSVRVRMATYMSIYLNIIGLNSNNIFSKIMFLGVIPAISGRKRISKKLYQKLFKRVVIIKEG